MIYENGRGGRRHHLHLISSPPETGGVIPLDSRRRREEVPAPLNDWERFQKEMEGWTAALQEIAAEEDPSITLGVLRMSNAFAHIQEIVNTQQLDFVQPNRPIPKEEPFSPHSAAFDLFNNDDAKQIVHHGGKRGFLFILPEEEEIKSFRDFHPQALHVQNMYFENNSTLYMKGVVYLYRTQTMERHKNYERRIKLSVNDGQKFPVLAFFQKHGGGPRNGMQMAA